MNLPAYVSDLPICLRRSSSPRENRGGKDRNIFRMFSFISVVLVRAASFRHVLFTSSIRYRLVSFFCRFHAVLSYFPMPTIRHAFMRQIVFSQRAVLEQPSAVYWSRRGHASSSYNNATGSYQRSIWTLVNIFLLLQRWSKEALVLIASGSGLITDVARIVQRKLLSAPCISAALEFCYGRRSHRAIFQHKHNMLLSPHASLLRWQVTPSRAPLTGFVISRVQIRFIQRTLLPVFVMLLCSELVGWGRRGEAEEQ